MVILHPGRTENETPLLNNRGFYVLWVFNHHSLTAWLIRQVSYGGLREIQPVNHCCLAHV